MAKLSPESRSEKMKAIRAAKKAQIQPETPSVSEEKVAIEAPVRNSGEKKAPEVKNPDLNSILERLEKVEQENEALKKSKENMFVKAKERYEWPRTFSYKIRGEVPVLSFTTFRKDPTKDLLFKNQFWQYESNHYLHVSLATWAIVDVEVNDFNGNHTKSKKLEAKDQHWEVIELANLPLAKEFTFENTSHGTFTVAKSAIN